MSYRIEYQWVCLALDDDLPLAPFKRRFVIAIEGGDNNLYVREGRREKRSRDWSIHMIGTHDQVLRQATRLASACESGCLKPGGRPSTPEAYIGRIRRLLDDPVATGSTCGYVSLHARLPETHALAAADLNDGFARRAEAWFGTPTVVLTPPGRDHWPQFFELIDPYLDDFSLSPWSVGEVYGLPRS